MEVNSATLPVHQAPPTVNYYYHPAHIANPSIDHYSSLTAAPGGSHSAHPGVHHHQPVTFNAWKANTISSAGLSSSWPDAPIYHNVAMSSHNAYEESAPPVYETEFPVYNDGPSLGSSEPKYDHTRDPYIQHYPDDKQYVSRATAEMLLSLKQINFGEDHNRHYSYPSPQHIQYEQRPATVEYGHRYTPQPVSVNFQMTMSCISGVASVTNPYQRSTNPPALPSTLPKTSHDLYRKKHGSSLLSHSRSGCDVINQHGEKVNICGICRKSYARPSTLKTHMRTHSGEKPYTCTLCPKTFTQAANLTAHMRTHSGEKPFLCPVCDRRFSQSSSVTTHMRTHSGERPYRCRVCKKAFSDSSTLTKHTRIHSGEKPYQCHLCLLKFSQSGNLNRHMKVHMAERSGQLN
ncbi:myoneurin-like [Paramacrobiotus metropolitanus]|uniref:myoneurin-like n=1 Tax=Paramacrobiotus metropolitanus TaxID=2943436 RepID=UPI002445BE5F|nr:myoneurin-like [Paramacrobiotus metropolitanus]